MRRIYDPAELPPFLKAVRKAPRAMTAWMRRLPDFLIIGAQRCGTTSLYRYLIEHPSIVPAFRKEVHFFDRNFRKGTSWYRRHFASTLHGRIRSRFGRPCLTGEATVDYLFRPYVAERVFRLLPDARLVVMLRNPIDRAYSHYHLERRRGSEPLSFEDALAKEDDRLRDGHRRMRADEEHDSSSQLHSYRTRGLYADQLDVWLRFFPRDQILVLGSEEFYADPAAALGATLEHLRLPRLELAEYRKYNYAGYTRLDAERTSAEKSPPMNAETRKGLGEFFAPHNERLFDLLGRRFDWDPR